LYDLARTSFSAVQRHDCWMLASGAYQAMLISPSSYYDSLIQFSETHSKPYPSQNLH